MVACNALLQSFGELAPLLIAEQCVAALAQGLLAPCPLGVRCAAMSALCTCVQAGTDHVACSLAKLADFPRQLVATAAALADLQTPTSAHFAFQPDDRWLRQRALESALGWHKVGQRRGGWDLAAVHHRRKFRVPLSLCGTHCQLGSPVHCMDLIVSCVVCQPGRHCAS